MQPAVSADEPSFLCKKGRFGLSVTSGTTEGPGKLPRAQPHGYNPDPQCFLRPRADRWMPALPGALRARSALPNPVRDQASLEGCFNSQSFPAVLGGVEAGAGDTGGLVSPRLRHRAGSGSSCQPVRQRPAKGCCGGLPPTEPAQGTARSGRRDAPAPSLSPEDSKATSLESCIEEKPAEMQTPPPPPAGPVTWEEPQWREQRGLGEVVGFLAFFTKANLDEQVNGGRVTASIELARLSPADL